MPKEIKADICPAADDKVESSSHSGILSQVPEYFYHAFAGELISVFSPDIFDIDICDEGRIRSVEYVMGTNGWNAALRAACDKLLLNWLYKYYDKLSWDESDEFDAALLEALESVVFASKRKNPNSYYMYLVKKYQGESYA